MAMMMHGHKHLPVRKLGNYRVLKTTSEAAQKKIEQLVAKWESKIRKSFLASIKLIRNNLDLEGIARELGANRIDSAIALADNSLTRDHFQPIAADVTAALHAGGAAAATDVTAALSFGSAEYRFNVLNPKTVDFMRNYEFNLITRLNSEARNAVRAAITDGVTAGRNPLTIANSVRDSIGLTPNMADAVSSYRDALEEGSSDALSRALRDRRFDSTVENVVDGTGEPLSAEQIDTMVERYAQRYLDYRADTISRTEASRATNVGALEAWKDAMDKGKLGKGEVRRYWVFTDDDKVRWEHTQIPVLNPDGVGLDEAFQTPDDELMYPGDPDGAPEETINCRCVVITQFEPGDEA